MTSRKLNLIKIIAYDIIRNGVISLILLILIIISATSILIVNHQIRVLTEKKGLMTEKKESLEIEWRNLILEENLLGNHRRIERISIEKLQMIHTNLMQERIILKNRLKRK